MGWKEAQARRKATSLTPPNDEDLIGRRVLNGLGLVERQVFPICKRIFGSDVNYEEGTWALSKKLFLYARGRVSCHPFRTDKIRIEAHTISKPDEIIERFEMWDPGKLDAPVFMVRLKNTKQSQTFSIWDVSEIGSMLQPPYKAIAAICHNGYHVAVQDTAHFVAQFGPYDWTKVLPE